MAKFAVANVTINDLMIPGDFALTLQDYITKKNVNLEDIFVIAMSEHMEQNPVGRRPRQATTTSTNNHTPSNDDKIVLTDDELEYMELHLGKIKRGRRSPEFIKLITDYRNNIMHDFPEKPADNGGIILDDDDNAPVNTPKTEDNEISLTQDEINALKELALED